MKTRTIKIHDSTYRLIKILCAEQGKTMVALLAELVDKEKTLHVEKNKKAGSL